MPFTVRFYGRPCETAQTGENMGKGHACKISFVIKSGRYYARVFAGGKEVWKSLKTSHFSVAQAKLAEFLKEHRERVRNGNGEVSAEMTFGEAAAIHLRNLDDNLSIKRRTRDYWRECLAALQKSWPRLSETEIRNITQPIVKNGCAHRKTMSATRYNNTVSVLRHVLNVAVECGVVYSNAAAVVKRAAVPGKEIALPTTEKFNAIMRKCAQATAEIRLTAPTSRKAWHSQAVGSVRRARSLCEFTYKWGQTPELLS